MSKDNVEKVNTPAPMTESDIVKQLLQTQRELAEAQKQLAGAILESRKPYVDPKVLEAKAQEGRDRKAQIERDQRAKAAAKKICPHIRDNGTSNVKWHEHSNNIVLGVCGTCYSRFDPQKDPADLALFRKDIVGMKNMARAGQHARRGAIIDA